MILAIDFDDTIHDTKQVPPGKKMGAPVKGAPEAIKQLYEAGHRIIVHTIWADSLQKIQAIKSWLEYFNIPHHAITNQKPHADIYIDDKALKFTNWVDTLKQIDR